MFGMSTLSPHCAALRCDSLHKRGGGCEKELLFLLWQISFQFSGTSVGVLSVISNGANFWGFLVHNQPVISAEVKFWKSHQGETTDCTTMYVVLISNSNIIHRLSLSQGTPCFHCCGLVLAFASISAACCPQLHWTNWLWDSFELFTRSCLLT